MDNKEPDREMNDKVKHQIFHKKFENSNDIINLNIKRYNPIGGLPEYAEFNSTRSDTILDKCSDYKLAITRFTVPSNIPNLLMPSDVILAQSYNVAIQWEATVITERLEYVPWRVGDFYPRSIYSITHWIAMVNTAYKKAHLAMKIAEPTYSPIIEPFLVFNRDKASSVGFYIPAEFIHTNTNSARILMSGNVQLIGLNGIPARADFTDFNIYGTPHWVYVDDWLYNRYTSASPDPPGQDFYIINSEFDPRENFNQITNIIFSTSSIPTAPELIAGNSAVTRRIITDFTIAGQISNVGTPITYTPSGPLRYYNMISDGPLRDIDLQVFIEYQNNELIPLYLLSGDSFELKIEFIKRTNTEKFGFEIGYSAMISEEEVDTILANNNKIT